MADWLERCRRRPGLEGARGHERGGCMNAGKPRISSAINFGLNVIVVPRAGLNLGGLLVLMVLRMRYPFQLEWVEGATATTSQWILSGHFLYERLSLQFTPLLINPLYFYWSAPFSPVLG